MSSLLETLAVKALAAAQAEMEDLKAAHHADALDIVRHSPLASWFPPLTWEVLDHNLHVIGRPHDVVVVTAQEDPPVDEPLQFEVWRNLNSPTAQWQVLLVHPEAVQMQTGQEHTVVRDAVSVGLWLQRHTPTGRDVVDLEVTACTLEEPEEQPGTGGAHDFRSPPA